MLTNSDDGVTKMREESQNQEFKLRHRLIPIAVWLFTAMCGCLGLAQESDSEPTELERLHQSGKPQTLLDLKPQTVPDKENAAWWLARADAGRLAIDMALAEEFEFDRPCDEAFINKHCDIVAQHPDTYELIHKAAALESYVPPITFDLKTFEDFSKAHDPGVMRSFARVLMYRSAVELAEGRVENAARSALAMLQLSRKPNLYYGMTGYLTRKAVQGMGTHSLSVAIETGKLSNRELLNEIQAELTRLDSLDDLVETIDSERVLGVRMMKDQGVVMTARIESYLRTMRLVQAKIGKTIAECPRLFTADDEKPKGLAAGQLMPGLQLMRRTAHRELTSIRLLRLQTAFLQDPDADNPGDLAVPEATRTDPVSGDPLVVPRPGK